MFVKREIYRKFQRDISENQTKRYFLFLSRFKITFWGEDDEIFLLELQGWGFSLGMSDPLANLERNSRLEILRK